MVSPSLPKPWGLFLELNIIAATGFPVDMLIAGTLLAIYDGNNLILVLEDGGETERYLYGMGDNEVLAQENVAGEVLWAIVDNQGSIRDLVDGNGVVLNHLVYDSFGNIVSNGNWEHYRA